MRLSPTSRLRLADLITPLGAEFFDIIQYPTIPVQSGDIYYTVKSTDRIDSIAYKFYGIPGLWWVIAVANGMQCLPSDLAVTALIRIPSPTWVNNQLLISLQKR